MEKILLFKERQGLATIVAVTLQCVLERTTREDAIEGALCEIEDAVGDAVADIRERLCLGNVRMASTTAAATPALAPSLCESRLNYASRTPSPAPKFQRSVAQTMLPVEVLRRMMTHLIRISGSDEQGCFDDLTAASAVCQRWRSVALSAPELWSVVHCSTPSEMFALETILRRSETHALRVELDLRRVPEHVRSAAIATVVPHMHRIRNLILRDGGTCVRTYDPLFASPAPILHELHLYSPRVQLRGEFLGGHAPHLRILTIGVHYAIPRSCATLNSLATLHLLHHSSELTVAEMAHLMCLCPSLKSLRLDFNLRDAPKGASAPVEGLRGLRELTLSEVGADGAMTVMAPTLRLFDFGAVQHVHLRAATMPTAVFFVKEMLPAAVHLFFSRESSVVVLRDGGGRQRALSGLAISTFDYLLKKAWAVSSQLTSLCVPDRIAACDAEALSRADLRALRLLSIFIRGPYAPSINHIFDLSCRTPKPWVFPALEDVCFATTPPARDPDVFPVIPTRPELSAAALRQFYVDMMQNGVKRKPSLTMVGVVLYEPFAGPDVGALRATFSAVTLRD